MKKRMFVYFFIFAISVFHLSIPNVVFGQSLAEQVFTSYEELLRRENVRFSLLNALRVFKRKEIRESWHPITIGTYLDSPFALTGLDENFDKEFINLLSTDDNFRELFGNVKFYEVLTSEQEIAELVELIEKTPAGLEKVVSTDNQHGEPNTSLQPFVVIVKDLNGDPLTEIEVAFHVTTEGSGSLSPPKISTKGDGQAQTTLTLGADPGIYQVEAKVVKYPSLTQTFTAAATGVNGESGVIISEIMFASKDGALPQWIELYNPSTDSVNLKDWKLEIRNLQLNGIPLNLKDRKIKPHGTLLIVSEQGRSSSNVQEVQVYNLNTLHPNLQGMGLSEEGFYLKLSNKAGDLIDEVGNIGTKPNNNKGKVIWDLPKSVTNDGRRASMIRRYNDTVPKLGTDVCSWISAKHTKLADASRTYYGQRNDIGAPGVKSGGALPVQLSSFRAERTETDVVIKWTTQSEVDNAGFYILRSEAKNGKFKVVNPALIQGAGTTGERNAYTWTDTTTKPNVAYYYRIEDVSYAGVREQSATVRMKGLVSVRGKFSTSWAHLKIQN